MGYGCNRIVGRRVPPTTASAVYVVLLPTPRRTSKDASAVEAAVRQEPVIALMATCGLHFAVLSEAGKGVASRCPRGIPGAL